ncbi:DUF5304 domain-containing protein [Kitasatospora sp. NBC_01287]|uniref:DUF5304 family protein n=1 Tax=Kitasatospora sp. NBC_01287 TaxID=2903573 RepID=UPI002258BE3C|nr:DUF5304 family protein [Kitasatospora sp. NBC_01287]MCX4749564.1 DUF5304 domain-containing protein [Kitasatospora sp. NBC_01287]
MNSSDPVDNPLVDEVRRLASAVGGQAERLFGRVKAENPDVFAHLSAAGSELLAAYRAAVAGHERRWSAPDPADSEPIDLDDEDGGGSTGEHAGERTDKRTDNHADKRTDLDE